MYNLYSRIVFKLARMSSTLQHTGFDVMSQDWDYMFLMDAARYDVFQSLYENRFAKRLSNISTLKKVISHGSSSPEFIKKNFMDKYHGDSIIITANPFVTKLASKQFFKTFSIWNELWDDKIGTVPPEAIMNYAIKKHIEHPDKKMIVWLMQPHVPFISDPKINQGYNFAERANDITSIENSVSEIITPWKAADRGMVDVTRVWRAYERDMDLAIRTILDRLDSFSGKIVITADHGEVFQRLAPGVRAVEHPTGLYLKNLVEVPWLEISKGQRPEIVPEAREENSLIISDVLKERMKALGYWA